MNLITSPASDLDVGISHAGRHFCSPAKAVRTASSQPCQYSQGSNRRVAFLLTPESTEG